MEAPNHLISVETLQPATNSHPGPEFEYGKGDFRTVITGKYPYFWNTSCPVQSIVSSHISFCTPTYNQSSPESVVPPPGCMPASPMEAPRALTSVEPHLSAIISHPGPEVENGEGDFQNDITGEYPHVRNNCCPVMPVASSHYTLHSEFGDTEMVQISENAATEITSPYIPSNSRSFPVVTAREPFSVYYQNVRGLRTKIARLRIVLSSCDYDVIVFTETWLKDDIESCEISSDYVLFRCDRNELTSQYSRGGGVLIAVKNCIKCEAVIMTSCEELEQIAVCIKLQHRSLYVIAIYLPPNSSTNLYRAHANAVRHVVDHLSESDIILSIGDFNLPNLRWHHDEDINGYIPSNDLDETELNFTQAMFVNGLRQINSYVNTNERLLDLVFTNLPEYLDILLPSSPLLPIDNHHTPFVLLLDENDTPTLFDDQEKSVKYDYSTCDFGLLNSVLADIEWENLMNTNTVDQMLSVFYEFLFDVISRIVPQKRQVSGSIFNKPWWTPELRKLRNNLRKMRNRYFQTKNQTDRARLRDFESEYKTVLLASHDNYLNKIQATVKKDPSRFWNFVKQRKDTHSIPATLKFGEITSHSNVEAANIFATFFESVFSKASPVQRQNCYDHIKTFNINLPCIPFNLDDIRKALEDLDSTKGPGTDDLPPVFWKNCAASLAIPVAAVFNRSIEDGVFPLAWKMACIVPIFKSGNSNCVSNYRGVSILCCLGKVFEKLVHAVLYRVSAPIITDSQHGFMKRRSTTTNLMCYVSAISRSFESKRQMDSVYVDFAKAFDTVPHNLIIQKMNHIGFPSWITKWIYSYLSDRKAFVIVNSVRSRIFTIPSGVPQGSVLGPLLFIIYVNDLCELLSTSKLLFADDLKIYSEIASSIDCIKLQDDINCLLIWCNDNGMRVNSKKCKAISYSRCNNVIRHQYHMGLEPIERANSICDLGVMIDSKLKFNEHIVITTAKAYTVLGFIRRHASGFSDVYCLKKLYCALVRSIMEYAAPVWSPFLVTQIVALERIQRSFMRFALRQLPWNDPINLPSYADRCKLIDLETLSARRTKLQRIFIYNLITGNVDCPELLRQVPWNIPPRRFRNSSLFLIPFHRTNYGFNNSFNLCLRSFNNVSDVFDFTLSKNVFSTRIRNLE